MIFLQQCSEVRNIHLTACPIKRHFCVDSPQSIESLVRAEIIKDMVFVRDKLFTGSISFMFGIIKLINIKTTFVSDSPGIIIIQSAWLINIQTYSL